MTILACVLLFWNEGRSVAQSSKRVVNVDDDVISSAIITNINWFTSDEDLSIDAIPHGNSVEGATLIGNNLFFGNDFTHPAVGDTMVSFDYVPSGTISLMAVQSDSSCTDYKTSRGGSVMFVHYGTVSADDMLLQAEAENEMMTWIFRLVGFLLMYVGFNSMLAPLFTFAYVFPIIGKILMGGGVPCLACVVTVTVSRVVIDIAWIFYRPLLGGPLLLLSGGLSYFVYKCATKEKENQPPVANHERYEMVKGQSVSNEQSVPLLLRVPTCQGEREPTSCCQAREVRDGEGPECIE